MSNFWLGELLKTVAFFLTTFALGQFLVKKGVKVNYTRKIFHFVFFFFPVYLSTAMPFEPSIYKTLTSGIVVLACLCLMWEPIRSRSYFLLTAYSSIDRPEDRPFTLMWISTQLVATYLVLVVMVVWLRQYDKTALIYIIILVAGIGDGLAEPVGVRFGKWKYTVGALFTDKKYTRSFEGSMCVFISGILAVLLLSEQLSHTQLVLSLLLIPGSMTLAEALSPHTWDGPFLYLVGGASTVIVLELSMLVGGY